MIKNFIRPVNLLFPFLSSSFIFILSSLVIYLLLNSFCNKREKFKLAVLGSNIEKVLKHDLESAIFGIDEKFAIFSNYKQNKKPDQQQSSVKITDQNTIIINNYNSELTLDLQELKEFVDKILPSYIVYKISLNDQIITTKGMISEQYQSLSSRVKISDITNLSVQIGIDKNSEYYLRKSNKFYRDYLIYISINLLISIVCLIFYYLLKNKFNTTRKKLLQNIDVLNNKNHCLSEYIEVCRKLENMYASFKYNSKIQLCEIDANELAKDLENYFSLNESNIIIKCNANAKHTQTCCSKEIFYQLIFSLINLLIMFMKGQSHEQKLLEVSFNAKQILIEFESFALDEQRMLYLADNVLSVPESFFLLDCRSLFQSLKDNNFKYNFDLIGEYNHKIEIITFSSEELPDSSKILKFRTSKDV